MPHLSQNGFLHETSPTHTRFSNGIPSKHGADDTDHIAAVKSLQDLQGFPTAHESPASQSVNPSLCCSKAVQRVENPGKQHGQNDVRSVVGNSHSKQQTNPPKHHGGGGNYPDSKKA